MLIIFNIFLKKAKAHVHLLLSIVAILLINSSCSRRLNTVNDQAPLVFQTYAPKLSNIIIPLQIKLDNVARTANANMPAILYEDNNAADDYVMAKVKPAGRLTLATDKGALIVKMPLHADLRLEYGMTLFPGAAPTIIGKSFSTDVMITTRSYLSITPDWKVKTTTSASYEWINPPNLGGLPISLAKVGDLIIKPRLSEINSMIDNSLADIVDIKSPVANAWKTIQDPIMLDNATQTWLQINPQAIEMGPITLAKGELNVKLAVATFLDLSTGSKPVSKAYTPLPRLKQNENIADKFSLNLSGQIGYDAATGLAKSYVAGQTYTYQNNKYSITVKDMGIEPYKNNMITVWADVDGSAGKLFKKTINGRVYLHGIPYYDADDGNLKLRDVDYSIDTKDQLAKAGAWVLKVGFDKMLKSMLKFPIRDQIKGAEQTVENRLQAKTQLGDYAWLSGHLFSITPIGVYVSPQGIKAVVEAEGNILVNILQ